MKEMTFPQGLQTLSPHKLHQAQETSARAFPFIVFHKRVNVMHTFENYSPNWKEEILLVVNLVKFNLSEKITKSHSLTC